MAKVRVTMLLMLVIICACAVTPDNSQLLILWDHSTSMQLPDTADPSRSRFTVAQAALDDALKHLPQNALSTVEVGLVSVGGCGASPELDLPVGTAPQEIAHAVSRTSADARGTDLTAKVQAVTSHLDCKKQGNKDVLIISDGMNSCPPVQPSVCEVAKQLFAQHGIRFHVATWVLDPSVEAQFRCLTENTGGTMISLQHSGHLLQWLRGSFGLGDPWPYVVFGGGFFSLLFAGRMLYRQGFHVWRLDTNVAMLAATLLLSVGTLVLYLALFANAGHWPLWLGIALFVGLPTVAAWSTGQSSATNTPSLAVWTIGVFVTQILFTPQAATAQPPDPVSCTRPELAPFVHIIGIDRSASMPKDEQGILSFVSDYGRLCVRPGDDVVVFVFAHDLSARVEIVAEFTVSDEGSFDPLARALQILPAREARTRSLYGPVAEFLNRDLLPRVVKEPVIVLISDNKSDDPKRDLPFGSFAGQGLYRINGVKGWMVAIQGGMGLNFSAVSDCIAKGCTPPKIPKVGLDPCLLNPQPAFVGVPEFRLWPLWYPFSSRLHGELSFRVQHQCSATRQRTFVARVRIGGKVYDLGEQTNVSIAQQPITLSFPFEPADAIEMTGPAKVEFTIKRPGIKDQAATPLESPIFTPIWLSYWQAYWWSLIGCGAVSLLLCGTAGYVVVKRTIYPDESPEFVDTGGTVAPLPRGHVVTLGGEGCPLAIPGVREGVVLGTATWEGKRGEVLVRPHPGTYMKVNGIEVTDSASYALGQPLQFTDGYGVVYDCVLRRSNPQSISPITDEFSSNGNGSSTTGYAI